MSGRVKVYFDFADWWVGLYIGPNHWYVCLLPCVVLRVRRKREPEPNAVMTHKAADEWFTKSLKHVAMYFNPTQPDARKGLWHIGTSGPLRGCARTDDHPITECEGR